MKKSQFSSFQSICIFLLKIKNLENKCFRRIEMVPILMGKIGLVVRLLGL